MDKLLLWYGGELPARAAAAQAELMLLLGRQEPPPATGTFWPQYPSLLERYRAALEGSDAGAAEEAFLLLYCHLHGNRGRYTAEERRRVDSAGGYWCHAGGISSVVRAGEWLSRDSVSLDLGAGNGLQLLLAQRLFPHRRTVMVEISSALIEEGRLLQGWLGIPPDRIEWVNADLVEYEPAPCDFLYLYRPLKPEGEGERFYRRLSESLSRWPRGPVIFSIADCLRDFLPASFEVFYCDGQLTCFGPPHPPR